MQDQITAGMREAVTTSLQKQADENKLPLTKQTTLTAVKHFLDAPATVERFKQHHNGDENLAKAFMGTIVSLVNSSTNFDGTSADSIIGSCLVAASLHLPINPVFGFAYIIPYNSKDGKKAQFQMGYKGFIQLALRTGQYQLINATEVYEGELVSKNRLTGQILLDETKKKSDKVIGYASYFRLVNGFEKTLYMSVEEIEAHAKTYSQTYKSSQDWIRKTSKWTTDFGPMAIKTLIKLLLSKYGILSVELQKAMLADQAVVSEKFGEEVYQYVDNEDNIADADISGATLIQNAEQAEVVEEAFDPSKENDPDYWIAKILECPNAEWKQFKKENKVNLSVFSGPDEERLNKIIAEKDAAVKVK